MSIQIKQSGILRPADLYVKQGAELTQVQAIHRKTGSGLELLYQNIVQVTLSSGTVVNLASKLSGVRDGANVEVLIPDGVVIGSKTAGQAALNVGDIRRFKDVRLIIAGEVQGRGGTRTARGANSAIWSAYPLTIELESTGAIRGGGGAGGDGGAGGSGSEIAYGNWYDSFYNSGDRPRYRWEQKEGERTIKIWWNDVVLKNGDGGDPAPLKSYQTYKIGDYTYRRQTTNTWSGSGYLYFDIQRGTTKTGTIGQGGKGGNGKGYDQVRTNNDGSQTTGTYGAGDGGRGGNGGTWGAVGSGGIGGTAGTISSGSGGGGGGGAGWAINTTSGNVAIKFSNNGGAINGGLAMNKLPVD